MTDDHDAKAAWRPMNESPARKRGIWVRGAVFVAVAACTAILLIEAHGPGNPSDVPSAGRTAATATAPSAAQTGTPSGTAAHAGDAQQASGAVSNTLSWQDQARLDAYRATTAAQALRHARRLEPGDAARADILALVASICSRLSEAERDTYVARQTKDGWMPDTDEQRRLFAAWWDRKVRYCGDVVGEAVRLEVNAALSIRDQRIAAVYGSDGIDLTDLAALDDDALVAVLTGAQGEDFESALGMRDIADRAWSILLASSNPSLAITSGAMLASSGQGPFAETRRLLELDPSDPRLWDGNTFHGSSRPGSREMKVWEATAEMFVCRTAGICGPATARGLFRRPVSEVHLAMGTEGYWRSMLTPLEWEAVETMLQRLEAERQAVRAR